MKIGIDARFYGPSGKGLGRYTQRLIENLEKIDQKNDYVIFLNDQSWSDYQPVNPRFKKVRANYRWYTLTEQVMMPLLIKRHQIGLMHFPHFNVAIFCPTDYVVTIHDLILLKFPTRRATTLGPIRYFLKQIGYMLVINTALKKAKRILAVSHFTKREILENFAKVRDDQVVVTYEACDSVETGQLKLPEYDLAKYGISRPYLLYVGNAYPHKNLEKLIDVFYQLDKKRPQQYQLVLVGKEDYFYRRLKKYGEKYKFSHKAAVIFFGFSPQSMLADLYRNGRLYVFPSLLEGFGLPPLEAMRYNLPVVAANNSACPEILGEAAVYFDPTNSQDILDVILRVLDNEQLGRLLGQSGQQRIKRFSWSMCAQQTLSVYQACLSSKESRPV